MSPEMHERIVWKSLRAERPGTTRQIYQAGNSGDVVVETDGAEYKDGVLYRGIFKKCVNSQAVYPLSEQHGLEAQERR